jgi:hypothetical protein
VNSFDHKRTVAQQLSNFVAVGSANTSQYNDNLTSFSWSDGTPTLNIAATRTGIYRTGLSNGFEVVLPADQTLRRLKMYVGLFGARGRFQATLSDLSAARYLDNSLISANNVVGTYTLFYAAASAGQRLTIRYISDTLIDPTYGNVTWQAGSVATVPAMPTLQIESSGTGLALSFVTEPSFGYAVECSDSLGPPSWRVLTNFLATGIGTTLTNLTTIAPQGFYRLKMQ